MDSVTRYEFHKIFDRVSENIDLKGRTSALAIELKLKDVRDRSKAKFKIYKASAKRVEAGRRAEWLDTLIEHDFAGRTIFEAIRNPRGMIALTLKHGRQEARQRILAQRRAELRARGFYAVVPRVARLPKIQEVPRRPEFRRIPTHRRQFRRWQS
jgi:hypothetical protein